MAVLTAFTIRYAFENPVWDYFVLTVTSKLLVELPFGNSNGCPSGRSRARDLLCGSCGLRQTCRDVINREFGLLVLNIS